MSKILQICTTGEIGGMERIVCSLTRSLNAREIATEILFPELNSHGNLVSWCHSQGVEAQTKPFVLPVLVDHTPSNLYALNRFIRAAKPDAVHLHYGSNFLSVKDVLAVRLAGRRHRIVASVHNVESWDRLGEKKRQMTRLAALMCDAVVANSRATEAVLSQAKIPAHKRHIIPCGVPPPKQHFSQGEARSQLGIPAQAFVVGTAARLVPRKRVDALIEAVARIPDPKGQILIVIAGDGAERSALEGLAASRLKDRAMFLGQVYEMDAFYAACDVFALPSVTEGFGVVYIEAAQHGIPSVGCDEAGTRDSIANGQTGLLVPPDDPQALADAIQRLRQTSLRQRMGQAARERALSEFSENIMGHRYARLLLQHDL